MKIILLFLEQIFYFQEFFTTNDFATSEENTKETVK